MYRRTVILALLLTLISVAVQAAVQEHPFLRTPAVQGHDRPLNMLQWGRTSLSYSQAWAGGRSFSQGMLLKGLRMDLAPGLSFEASFGMSFQPTNQWGAESNSTEFVLPYAAVHWQIGDSFSMQLEYSNMGDTGMGYYKYYSPFLSEQRSFSTRGDTAGRRHLLLDNPAEIIR